jgi:hypothetical protein
MPAVDQGARYSPIRWDDQWFRGEDKRLRFKVTLADGTIPDFTGWTFHWFLRQEVKDADPILDKAGTAIQIVSADDPDDPAPIPAAIDMVQVDIARADTETLAVGQYVHALVRTDTGEWAVVSEGEAILRPSAGG